MKEATQKPAFIGGRMRVAREFLGLSQQGLADQLGVSKRGIQDNETRNRVPGGDVINGFVRLGINANWLLTGDGPMLLADLQAAASGVEPILIRDREAVRMYMNVSEPAPENDFGRIHAALMENCLRACEEVYGEPFKAMSALDQLAYAIDFYNLIVKMTREVGNNPNAALRLEVSGLAEQLRIFLKMEWAKRFPPPLSKLPVQMF